MSVTSSSVREGQMAERWSSLERGESSTVSTIQRIMVGRAVVHVHTNTYCMYSYSRTSLIWIPMGKNKSEVSSVQGFKCIQQLCVLFRDVSSGVLTTKKSLALSLLVVLCTTHIMGQC